MAIEQFGESLLASKSDREKKEKRSTLLLGAAKIGIDLYGNSIKKKAEEFASNAQVWSNRVKYKNALDNSQVLLTTLQGSENYGGGQRQWVIDNIARPKVNEQLARVVPEELYGEDSLGSYTQEQAERMVDGYEEEDGTKVKGMLELLKEAQTAAQNLKGIDDYDAMVQINNNTPKSVADAAYQRLFGKKDAEALQQEAINKIVNSKFSKNAAAAQVAMDAFYGGATVKDSEALAANFAAAVEAGKVKEKPAKVEKRVTSRESAISGQKMDVIEITTTDVRGNVTITHEYLDGTEPTVVMSETRTSRDVFNRSVEEKVNVVRNLVTGKEINSAPDTTAEPIINYEDTSQAVLNLPTEYVKNIGDQIGTTTNEMSVDGKIGTDILEKYINQYNNPEAARQNLVNQIALTGFNIATVTNSAIPLSTGGDIAMAIAVNEAYRAQSPKGSLNKASTRTMNKPNAILIIEAIATLEGTPNALNPKDTGTAINSIIDAHKKIILNNGATHQLAMDFRNIDSNIRHNIIMGDTVSKVAKNLPVGDGTLYDVLVATHRATLKEELENGTLIENEAIMNFLATPTVQPAPVVSLAELNTAAENQPKEESFISSLGPFGGEIRKLNRTEKNLREKVAEAQNRADAYEAKIKSQKTGPYSTQVQALTSRRADLKKKQDALESFLNTKEEEKPTPVSPKVAKGFRGLTVPAVEKVREYLEDPNADTSEDVLSDLAKASGYDPEVMKLLRVSYNYEPNKGGL
jgi:hypothetical protein